MNSQLKEEAAPLQDLAWWAVNVRGMFPPEVGLNVIKTEDMRSPKANQSVFFFELKAAGLNDRQAQVVHDDGPLGLHTITAAGGTGWTTPVAPDVFLKVLNLLVTKENKA